MRFLASKLRRRDLALVVGFCAVAVALLAVGPLNARLQALV